MALELRTELQIVMWTRLRAWLFPVALLGAFLWLPVSAMAASFSGQFDGIGTALGMTLTLEEAEGRVVGRFASGNGDPFSLNGRRTGEAAQGSMIRPGQDFFFHLEQRPLGVQFLLIPKTLEGGPDISGATDYSFVQQGLQVPKPSAFQVAPPRGIDVDIIDFIDAFRDWDPVDMARVYASLDDKYKELIQLFDHAASEIVWRVCAINPPISFFSQAELDRLLERQRTTCVSYLGAVAAARDAGLLNEFLRKANFQFELIRETVKCDRGQSSETKCADVSAMSGPLMVRWRRANDIMSELVGESGADGQSSLALAELSAPDVVNPLGGDVSHEGEAAQILAQPTGDIPVPFARPVARNKAVVQALMPQVLEEQVLQVPVPRVRPGRR